MIVISGILLLIAVVFLVIGLFGPLAWVYASIAVSVLSFVFLLVGVRQRRDVVAPSGAPVPSMPRGGLPAADEPASADVTLVPAGGRAPAASAAATAALVEEKAAPEPARVERPRPAVAAPARPARPTTPAASRLRSSSSTRPRAVLPARLAEAEGTAKKTAAKKTTAKKAPAKAAAKKAAPAKKTAAASTAKKAPAKKAASTAKKAAPAKKTAAKKTAAKKTAR